MSVTGIRLKCTHRFKIPLSVGDFALVLTCQKGRYSDIHRHRFVDIWCWPCPGHVVMVLLKNMQLHWCKFATWRSIILWVAPEKYLVIHLGKRKYICQMCNKCVHIESLQFYSCLHYLILQYFSMISHDKPADNTSLPEHTGAQLSSQVLLTKHRCEPRTSRDTLHDINSGTNYEIFIQLKRNLECGNLRTVFIIAGSIKLL